MRRTSFWIHVSRLFLAVFAVASVGWGIPACATQITATETPPVDAGPPVDAVVACKPNFDRCSSGCTNTQQDPNNCGACGNECGANTFCYQGECHDTCQSPIIQCGAICADPSTDPENCGRCRVTCSDTQECVNGSCQKKCPAGRTLCDGTVCSDLHTDSNHCGTCTTSCDTSSGETCGGGICCGEDQQNCNGTCLTTAFDDKNCGACGYACGGGTPYCVTGACQTCNPSVLILSDDVAANANAMAALLTAAGLRSVVATSHSYSAIPSSSGFGTVLVMPYGDQDMPAAGQTNIATSVNSGRGLVVVDYYMAYYSQNDGYWATLAPLLPITFSSSNNTGNYVIHTLTKVVDHLVWGALTSPLTLASYQLGFLVNNNGGTVVATTTEVSTTNPAIVVKDAANGRGREVYFSTSLWTASSWTTDVSATTLITNAVKWSTGCF